MTFASIVVAIVVFGLLATGKHVVRSRQVMMPTADPDVRDPVAFAGVERSKARAKPVPKPVVAAPAPTVATALQGYVLGARPTPGAADRMAAVMRGMRGPGICTPRDRLTR